MFLQEHADSCDLVAVVSRELMIDPGLIEQGYLIMQALWVCSS